MMSQDYADAMPRRQTLEYEIAERSVGRRMLYPAVKWIFDFCAGFFGILLLSPVFAALAAAVYLSDPGPVFYGHERLGENGRKIKVWKFRSMYKNADEMFLAFTDEQKEEFYRDFKLENDPRITPVGKFLRKSSLDELPQLWNILRGELSVVGPRPIVEKELLKYGSDAARFLSVKPGLTGYWQANGRNLINYENGRKEMELYYVEHQGFLLDAKIMLKTVGAVLHGKGAQ